MITPALPPVPPQAGCLSGHPQTGAFGIFVQQELAGSQFLHRARTLLYPSKGAQCMDRSGSYRERTAPGAVEQEGKRPRLLMNGCEGKAGVGRGGRKCLWPTR